MWQVPVSQACVRTSVPQRAHTHTRCHLMSPPSSSQLGHCQTTATLALVKPKSRLSRFCFCSCSHFRLCWHRMRATRKELAGVSWLLEFPRRPCALGVRALFSLYLPGALHTWSQAWCTLPRARWLLFLPVHHCPAYVQVQAQREKH